MQSGSPAKFKKRWIVAALLLVGVLAFGVYNLLSPDVDKSTYQLIRVESGESYVGKLSNVSANYIELDDVYVYQAPATSDTSKEQTSDATRNQDLTLVPVSSIKGTMYISRAKVVYWGNLENEGPVVNAIKSDKNKKD